MKQMLQATPLCCASAPPSTEAAHTFSLSLSCDCAACRDRSILHLTVRAFPKPSFHIATSDTAWLCDMWEGGCQCCPSLLCAVGREEPLCLGGAARRPRQVPVGHESPGGLPARPEPLAWAVHRRGNDDMRRAAGQLPARGAGREDLRGVGVRAHTAHTDPYTPAPAPAARFCAPAATPDPAPGARSEWTGSRRTTARCHGATATRTTCTTSFWERCAMR